MNEGERVSPFQPKQPSRGRPIVHTEPWAKITVVLLDRHVAYLDRLAIDIRLKHGKAISRAEIIRGLIEAAIHSGVDLSQSDSIDTLVELLTGAVPKRKNRCSEIDTALLETIEERSDGVRPPERARHVRI